MKKLLMIVAFFLFCMNGNLFAEQDQNRSQHMGKGMMQMPDSSCMQGMMMMHMMSPRFAFGTPDGGVIVIIGNKMYKYDRDLNLKKEVEFKVDTLQMDKMKQKMHQCPMDSTKKSSDSSNSR